MGRDTIQASLFTDSIGFFLFLGSLSHYKVRMFRRMFSAKEPPRVNLKWQTNWLFLRKYPFIMIYRLYHKNPFVLLVNRRSKLLAGYCNVTQAPSLIHVSLSYLLKEKLSETAAMEGVFLSVVQSSRAQENRKSDSVSFPWGKNSYRCA